MVIPGSVGDWMQALVMVAAMAGLSAAGRRALQQEEEGQAPPRRPGPSRPPGDLVEATAPADKVEARR
jgi:hypothetical protein